MRMRRSRLFSEKPKPGPFFPCHETVLADSRLRQAQAVMESEALAKQIDAIARSMTDQEPTPVQRKIAADLLLEIRRLEQLKAIASSKTNSVSCYCCERPGANQFGYRRTSLGISHRWAVLMVLIWLKGSRASLLAHRLSRDLHLCVSCA